MALSTNSSIQVHAKRKGKITLTRIADTLEEAEARAASWSKEDGIAFVSIVTVSEVVESVFVAGEKRE